MELLGLERCREYLESKDIKVEEITTDRHISINAYIKKHWKDVSHLFDLWHLGKGKLPLNHIKLTQIRVLTSLSARHVTAFLSWRNSTCSFFPFAHIINSKLMIFVPISDSPIPINTVYMYVQPALHI